MLRLLLNIRSHSYSFVERLICPKHCHFSSNRLSLKFSDSLKFHEPNQSFTAPAFQVLSESGEIKSESFSAKVKELSASHCLPLKLYKCMLQLKSLDDVMYECQRQGRITFYMTHYGEEAASISSAAALRDSDMIFSQYREAGALLWRDCPLSHLMNQMFANEEDSGKGRQMPVHYGNKQLNFQTISSPLATQMPHAVGFAYASCKVKGENKCAIVYFGEGAASEGDSYVAMNFAAVLGAPVIFFCRNNEFAISTPSCEQYRGDAILDKGLAIGLPSIRVDGNDPLALFFATEKARELCMESCGPVLLEAISYRLGHHSTSDDSSVYRDNIKAVHRWTQFSPIHRLKRFLIQEESLKEEDDKEMLVEARKETLKSMAIAEKVKKPNPIGGIFSDVYDEEPLHLRNQKSELNEHLKKYASEYDIQKFSKN